MIFAVLDVWFGF